MTVRGADCDEVLSCQGLRDLGCVVNDGGVTQNASGKSEDVQAVQWRRWWAFAVPLTIIVGVAIVAVVWWLVWPSNLPTAPPEPLGSPSSSGATGDPGAKASDPGMLQIQAVRTILTAAAGIGALFGLVMIARRQQLQEVAHDLDREVARDNRHDATERRITELYMAAAEQLGHARAAVRLAALHALDRLGQNDVNHRQVIADIWCSYLRQPFALPARFTSISHTKKQPVSDSARADYFSDPEPDSGMDSADLEYEVRATAQRLLASHLRDPREEADRNDKPPPITSEGFWGLSGIDLTGATLINAEFIGCWLESANFSLTEFYGVAMFFEAQFQDVAMFVGAQFDGDAEFGKTQFYKDAVFAAAKFRNNTGFNSTRFKERATFGGAHFGRDTEFDEAQFDGDAVFNMAQFGEDAAFTGTQFTGTASYNEAQFGRDAWFNETRFGEATVFAGAQFGGEARFDNARFRGAAWFDGVAIADRIARRDATQFGGEVGFDKVVAVMNPGKKRLHMWPSGWALEEDPEGLPGWGRLRKEPMPSNPKLDSPVSE